MATVYVTRFKLLEYEKVKRRDDAMVIRKRENEIGQGGAGDKRSDDGR